MKKTEKTLFVENLSHEIKDSKVLFLVDYSNLTVKLQQDLSRRLKAVGAKMVVVKNTLFKLAAKKAKYPEEMLEESSFSGQTALVVGEGDPISPIQVIAKFAKEFELPKFKAGVVEGVFQNSQALITLSKLPSREILFGQVVGAVSSPLYGLVGTLNGNLQKLVYILKTKSEENSKGGDN